MLFSSSRGHVKAHLVDNDNMTAETSRADTFPILIVTKKWSRHACNLPTKWMWNRNNIIITWTTWWCHMFAKAQVSTSLSPSPTWLPTILERAADVKCHFLPATSTSTGLIPKNLGVVLGTNSELILYSKSLIHFHDSMAKNVKK